MISWKKLPQMSKLARLDKIFTIDPGNKFDRNKMITCGSDSSDKIAFVGRGALRNGIVVFVQRYNDVEPYDAGKITVALGGSALASFVQQSRFYTAQNVAVLTPMTDMSLEVKLYYCLCIEANRFRYSTFGREANRTLKSLLLPDVNSLPSWIDGCAGIAVDKLCRDLKTLSSANQALST